MADWTRVTKFSPETLGIGALGSEVTITASGLELNVTDGANTDGTAITAITAGKLMTMNTADVVGILTIATGLTTVNVVVASMAEDSTTVSAAVTAAIDGTTVSNIILKV